MIVEDASRFARQLVVQEAGIVALIERGVKVLMFEDSVKVRGLTAALAVLPEERRTKYRAYLKEHTKPWWKPDAIWGNWSQALKILEV